MKKAKFVYLANGYSNGGLWSAEPFISVIKLLATYPVNILTKTGFSFDNVLFVYHHKVTSHYSTLYARRYPHKRRHSR